MNAGKQVLAAMMEADRVALCGAKNVPDAGRKAVRGGTTRSSVVLGGQRIAVTKPRARSLLPECHPASTAATFLPTPPAGSPTDSIHAADPCD